MVERTAIRSARGERVFDWVNVTFMIVLMFVMLYPLLHVIFSSVSDSNRLMSHTGLVLRPYGFTLAAYSAVFQNRIFASGYANTLINVSVTIVLNVGLTTLGAFALSRRDLMFGRPLMILITFTMVFSGGLIPLYLLVRSLGMTNTRWALILPTAISAYNLIIMKTAFESIPESLFESARMDGANDFVVLVAIALPVSLSAVAVMVLFYGVEQWNAWFPAMIYLKERSLWPLQLVLREIVVANTLNDMLTSVEMSDKASIAESIKYATVVVATLPILFAYPFLQRFFVKGVMIGSIKG
jgi:putative aldouronate transport system permease protein